MKKLFLTSSVDDVAGHISKKVGAGSKKLVFIFTAAEGEDHDLSWLDDDRNALIKAGFEVTDYTLTGKSKAEVEAELQKYDVFFFSGGNTFYLLEKIQQSDSAEVIRKLINDGKIYIGSSAGSIIAGPDLEPIRNIDEMKKAPNLKDLVGLGLVDIVLLPHWGSPKFRQDYLGDIEHLYDCKNKLILLNDNQYLEVDNDSSKIVDITLD